jgi:hypothetical protein
MIRTAKGLLARLYRPITEIFGFSSLLVLRLSLLDIHLYLAVAQGRAGAYLSGEEGDP